MKRVKHFLTCVAVIMGIYTQAQQPFTAGNFVVYRVGGVATTTLGANMTEVFIDEYTPSGTLVQSILMPTSGTKVTQSGNLNLIGYMNLSTDGRYLVVPGFNMDLGTTATSVVRSIGLVDYTGTVSSVASIPFNGDNVPIYGATSDNGTNIWLTTTNATVSPSLSTVEYTTAGFNGASSLISVLSSGTIPQNIGIANGQLYAGVNSIGQVGTGLPTTSGQLYSALPGIGDTVIAQQFAFADLDPTIPGIDVLYVASQGVITTGIVKYSLVDGSWVQNGQISTTTSADRYSGLAIKVSGTSVTIFATRRGSNSSSVRGGDIVTVTDNSGYGGTLTGSVTVLASVATRFGGANRAAFRGVALVPQPPAVKLSVKAFLQGAYNNSVNRHKDVTTTWASVLNATALAQPYNVVPFNYAGTESVSNGFFTSNAGSTTDILDWVLLELRDENTPTTVISRRAALIREDGQIVDTDGSSPVSFTASPNGVPAGNYYVVVKHRNHLNVRSATAIALSTAAASYDFTDDLTKAFQNTSITSNEAMVRKDLNGAATGPWLMWGGNANSDGLVRASAGANVNDYLTLMSPANLNGNTSTILSNVYRAVDMNLDGTVRASAGSNVNDYLVLMSPGILNGNTSNIITAHN